MEAPPSDPSPRLEIHDTGLAHVVFEDPERKLNVLTREVMERLDEIVGELELAIAAGSTRAVLIRSGKTAGFIAGADIEAIRELSLIHI